MWSITVGQSGGLAGRAFGRGYAGSGQCQCGCGTDRNHRTSTTDTIEQRRIDNLPINGRNYINFALTDSQVLRDNAPSIGAAPTSG